MHTLLENKYNHSKENGSQGLQVLVQFRKIVIEFLLAEMCKLLFHNTFIVF